MTDWAAAAKLGVAAHDDVAAQLEAALASDDPEDRRFGDYELVERLGRGGMGVVFRARQASLARDVALKFVVGGANDAAAVARFVAEARAAARLNHPNIVPVYEVGVVEGLHYFSMPMLAGATLAQRLDERRVERDEAIALMVTIGSAVDYAHRLGLLHLDLKPGNVLFDDRGEPLVADFGLARTMDADGGVDGGDVSGTPAYMAPEQRDAARRLDRRTDVYALGAMLAELLRGDAPDADLDAICRRCLEPDPARRYASAADLVADLARRRDGNAVSVRVPAWHERWRRSVRQHPAAAIAVALAFAMLIAGLAATTSQWRRAEAARADAARQQARTAQLAGLTAAAFPQGEGTRAAQAASAGNAVAWLQRHLAGDPAAQREVLTAFRVALAQAGKAEAVTALLDEIVDRMGADYRERAVGRLFAGRTRDGTIAAALVGLPRGAGEHGSDVYESALAALYTSYGDDAYALYVAALACHVQPLPCEHPEYRERLVERFPDNGAHWIVTPRGAAPSDDDIAAIVRRAAQAPAFDDHLGESIALVRGATRATEPPPSLVEPMRALVEERDVAPSLRRRAIDAAPLPVYGDVVRVCRPDGAAIARVAGLRDACGTLAQTMMRAPRASILAKMVGSAMVRRLYPNTPLGAEAYDLRRQYVWLGERALGAPNDAERLYDDTIAFGEWEAFGRQADRRGAARTPPAGWQPLDARVLMLPEERDAKK